MVAMGTSARNLILLGRPVQGVYPGRSGSLAPAPAGWGATIAEERGIFLPTNGACTRPCAGSSRMRCTTGGCIRSLNLKIGSAHPALKSGAISFVGLERDGNSHSSRQKQKVREIFDALLLAQSYADGSGKVPPVGIDDDGRRSLQRSGESAEVSAASRARAETIDKSHGQEAAVVIVSMTVGDWSMRGEVAPWRAASGADLRAPWSGGCHGERPSNDFRAVDAAETDDGFASSV
jgi:hypothetical protein